MDVYIVRHAIAETRDPSRWPDDAKRPLTTDGAVRFRNAARGLHRIIPPPEQCPALEAVNPPNAALDLLQSRSERSVALVGHEPYLSSLASLLVSGDERALRLKLKKGAVALLAFATEPAPGRHSCAGA